MIPMHTRNGLPFALSSSLVLLLAGCPGDDSPAETDSEGSSGTTGDATATAPTATTTTTTDADSTTTSEPTTTGVDTTAGEESSTGEPLNGTCIGLDQVGDIDTVFSRDGMPIDASCTLPPAPCGGDVLGTWAIEAQCGYEAFPNPFEQDCPGSTFEIQVVGQMGTVTFENDGTFTQDLSIDLQALLSLDPMACFGIDCVTLEAGLQMDNPAATCMSMMGTCNCTIPGLNDPPMVVMGTYEVMGDSLMLDVGGEQEEFAFCVTGDRLDTWNQLFIDTITETMCVDEQDCIDALGDMHELYVCIEEPMG